MTTFKGTLDERDLHEILHPVLRRYHVTPGEVGGRSRHPHISEARAAFVQKLRAPKVGWSFPAIGKLLGRDHSSIMHLAKRPVGMPACAHCGPTSEELITTDAGELCVSCAPASKEKAA